MCTSHIHIPIHTCTSPHKRTLTYKHMNISVNTHSQTLPKDTHINVCIPPPHTCTHLHLYSLTQIDTHAFLTYSHACIHKCTHTHTQTYSYKCTPPAPSTSSYIYTYSHTEMHICTYPTYTVTHIYTHANPYRHSCTFKHSHHIHTSFRLGVCAYVPKMKL